MATLPLADQLTGRIIPQDTRGEIDRLKEIMEMGKSLGYENEELRTFVKEQQDRDRDERQAEREAEQKRLEAEAEQKRLEAEAEQKRLEAEAEQKRLEAEQKKLETEAEERRQQREAEERKYTRAAEAEHAILKLEIEKMRIEKGSVIELQSAEGNQNASWRDIIRMVPKFTETDLAEYFASFEKLMKMVNCPQESWSLVLQSVLVGKALKAYSCLSDDDSLNYLKVKEAVLKAYKLVPEAYRVKFRSLRKDLDMSYMEFARAKEHCFGEWCDAKDIRTLEDLKQLTLLEDFESNIPSEIRLYIEDCQATTLAEAAKLADTYAITHHLGSTPSNQNMGMFQNTPRSQKSFSFRSWNQASVSNKSASNNSTNGSNEVECHFCGRKGHKFLQCFKLKAHKEAEKKKPVALIQALGDSGPELEISEVLKPFANHISQGELAMSPGDSGKSITVLRDSGGSISLVLKSSLPSDCVVSTEEFVLVTGFPNIPVPCPLTKIYIKTQLIEGEVTIAVADVLPVPGVDLILGNDLVDDNTIPFPVVREEPLQEPVVAVTTRSGMDTEDADLDLNFDLSVTNTGRSEAISVEVPSLQREDLAQAQREDKTLNVFFADSLGEEEVDDLSKPKFIVKKGVLHRVSRSLTADSQDILDQIVVPVTFQQEVMRLAHENILSGHLGVNKTLSKIRKLFFWPSMKTAVKKFVSRCHHCQLAGKPNKPIPKAPLNNIPAVGEPFESVVIDIVGPLVKSRSGNIYILTIIDRMSRYPEAIPIRSTKAPIIVKHLIDYFTRFGMPKTIQSDNGSNFCGKFFQSQMRELGIKHITSTPYHPESQGIVERMHQTLKNILRKLCDGKEEEWDKKLPFALFALRSAPSETLGFSPFELIFGHTVRGPLEILRDSWEEKGDDGDVVAQVEYYRTNLFKAWDLAKENQDIAHDNTKRKYDKKAKARSFQIGEFALALLPKQGGSLQYKFSGPYKILDKRGDVNYCLEIKGSRKKRRWLHINLLKKYEGELYATSNVIVAEPVQEDLGLQVVDSRNNTEVMNNLEEKLSYLEVSQVKQVKELLLEYPAVIKDTPGLTHLIEHDIQLLGNDPIRQQPYRLNPKKAEVVNHEVQYMLDHKLATPSISPWASPVVLVKKEDNQHRLCIDYRKVNAITKPDNFPLPRVIDCLDQIGNAKFISKIDLLKGYWQVPLSEGAREVSAFVTPSGAYECLVMPFGMRNAASTFQRLMSKIINNIKGCVVYLDDLVIFSDTWEEHLDILRKILQAINDAGLVINLRKCEFCKARVTYLGHQIGLGTICPKESNIEAILEFPVPKNKKEAMRFVGMIGYFRRFIPNFSDIAAPITALFKKNVVFNFDGECMDSFNKLKSVIINRPVLYPPNFSESFSLTIDASDLGVGAVLFQNVHGVEHPVSYFSKKLNKHQVNYSTIEKELLALILALQHYEIYVGNSISPVAVFSDHNPLQFLNKFKNKNRRLTRWSLELQDYNLEIKHVKGKDNLVADALSRGFG